MDIEALVRSYLVAGDAGDEEAVAALLEDDVVTHAPGGAVIRGVDATVGTWRAARAGLSDLRHEVVDVLVSGDGDAAAVRVEVSGRHTGSFLGVAPTGAQVRVDQALFVRVAERRIAEMWEVVDTGRGMQQLGVLGNQQLSPGSG